MIARDELTNQPIPRGRIAWRLVVAIVLFSSFITLLTTGLQLYSEYSRDIEEIGRDFHQISDIALPNLAENVWVSSDEQIMTQLKGLLRMPDMEYLGLRVENQVRWEVGTQKSTRVLIKEFPLFYSYRGEDMKIGVLQAIASVDNVYARLWTKVVIILASNAFKTFLVTGFIFLLFQTWVTRHLDKIADYVRRLRLDGTALPLELDRRSPGQDKSEDELDQVVKGINEMRFNLIGVYENLQISENRYRKLFENSPSALWEMNLSDIRSILQDKSVFNPGGEAAGMVLSPKTLTEFFNRVRIMDINESTMRLFEDRDKEHLKKNLWRCLTAESVQCLEFFLRSLEINNSVDECETPIQTVLNTRKDILLHWKVIPGYQESWSKILVSATDITEHRKVEDQRRTMEAHLQETQKLESLGVLAGGIAHDFNNLLVGILGNADLALEELPAREKGRKYIERIRIAADHAADLTRELLAYSGQGRFVIQAISLNPLIEEMVGLLKTTLGRGANLEIELEEDLPAIEADSTQIRQVIMNLVMNASDALEGKEGSIGIKTGVLRGDRAHFFQTLFGDKLADGKYVFVEVSDTGIGMDSETQGKMFDPFFTTKVSGRGLGMAAVKGIIRGHGGDLNVSSRSGQGTTITVILPSTVEPVPALKFPVKTASKFKGTGRVMVIDDNETTLEVVHEMLGRNGFKVCTFNNGREAIEEYKRDYKKIVLVLVDMTMPHLDGWATFRELKGINPEVKAIMISGYSEQQAVGGSGGEGIKGFIQKPFPGEVLMAKIGEVLKER